MNALISVSGLQGLLASEPPPLLLDLRFDLVDAEAGRRAFVAGHLPGAHYLHLDEDLCGSKRSADGVFHGRHPLPDREIFAERLRRLGWTYARTVVCMDAGNAMFAARAWWMLRWLGHEAVAVLDGGVAAWQAQGLPLTELATLPPEPAGPFPLRGPAVRTIDKSGLRARLGSGRLVDARAGERFRGEVEPLDTQAGHIPGARNRPFADNLEADGRFKPAAQLRGEWSALGVDAHSVHACGSGVSACHNLLALSLAGLPIGTLYPGSWSEWSADPTLPMAKG